MRIKYGNASTSSWRMKKIIGMNIFMSYGPKQGDGNGAPKYPKRWERDWPEWGGE